MFKFEEQYREKISECADLTRSLMNRRGMMGIYTAAYIFAINKSLVPLAGADVERAFHDKLTYVGTISPALPTSQYWERIYEMARKAPLF